MPKMDEDILACVNNIPLKHISLIHLLFINLVFLVLYFALNLQSWFWSSKSFYSIIFLTLALLCDFIYYEYSKGRKKVQQGMHEPKGIFEKTLNALFNRPYILTIFLVDIALYIISFSFFEQIYLLPIPIYNGLIIGFNENDEIKVLIFCLLFGASSVFLPHLYCLVHQNDVLPIPLPFGSKFPTAFIIISMAATLIFGVYGKNIKGRYLK